MSLQQTLQLIRVTVEVGVSRVDVLGDVEQRPADVLRVSGGTAAGATAIGRMVRLLPPMLTVPVTTIVSEGVVKMPCARRLPAASVERRSAVGPELPT